MLFILFYSQQHYFIIVSLYLDLRQESIPPNFVILCFPVFAVKLSHFVTLENIAISVKLPSLRGKNRKKMSVI
jgi:hypothetical protein